MSITSSRVVFWFAMDCSKPVPVDGRKDPSGKFGWRTALLLVMGAIRKTTPDLAAIRGNRRVSLEQIAASTKISTYYLQAIENGEIEKLPGGIYRKSYVRQYARAIDYNECDLLDRYDLSGEPYVPVHRPEFSSRQNRLARFLTLLTLPKPGTRRTG